jgi:type IV pilus biogenesis protein CpaD/CtpE
MLFNSKKFKRNLLVLASGVLLSACSMEVPTQVSHSKAVVGTSEFRAEVPVEAVDNNLLAAVSEHYRRVGNGTVYLSVIHDAQASKKDVREANDSLDMIEEKLRGYGVSRVEGEILPVKDLGDVSSLLVNFEQVHAMAPENCDSMPGYGIGSETGTGVLTDYNFGCQSETLFAQQIARPSDLLGNETDTGPGYSSRTFNDTAGYQYNVQHILIRELGSGGTTN